jgi:hypothetical protein
VWLIDPPVTPYDPPDAIREWIAELEALPESAERAAALAEARAWLVAPQCRSRAEGAA